MLKNLLTIICFAFTQVVFSQVICYPYFPRQIDSVTIIYDATQGNGALEGVSPIYIHSGLITNNSSSLSDWQHVSTTWAVTDPDFEMLDLGDNKHQFSFKIDVADPDIFIKCGTLFFSNILIIFITLR